MVFKYSSVYEFLRHSADVEAPFQSVDVCSPATPKTQKRDVTEALFTAHELN